MNPDSAPAIVWSLVLLALLAVLIAIVFSRRRDGHGGAGVGPAAVGAVYDMLNQDKRNAIELIVEEKAGARDPEDADGNLPDLESPKRPR